MTQAEVQAYRDKLDAAKVASDPLLEKTRAGNQPTKQEVDAARAAYDALVIEGEELF